MAKGREYSKVSIKRPVLLNDQVHLRKKSIELFHFRAATANFWSLLNNLGVFHLVDLVIPELTSHMTCYNSIPLIGWNYSIQSGDQIL